MRLVGTKMTKKWSRRSHSRRSYGQYNMCHGPNRFNDDNKRTVDKRREHFAEMVGVVMATTKLIPSQLAYYLDKDIKTIYRWMYGEHIPVDFTGVTKALSKLATTHWSRRRLDSKKGHVVQLTKEEIEHARLAKNANNESRIEDTPKQGQHDQATKAEQEIGEQGGGEVMSRGKKPMANFYQCSFPNCTHRGAMMTKIHCRTHGMERDELFEKYGDPQPVFMDTVALRNNGKMKTIFSDNPPVKSGQKRGASRT